MQQINETESYNQSNPSAEPVIASEADAAGPAPAVSSVSPSNPSKSRPFWVRVLGLRSRETGQYDIEDQNRRSTLLRNMDIAVLVFLAVTIPSAYFMKLLSTGDYTSSGLAFLAVVISYALLRLNQVVLASYTFIGGILLGLVLRSTDVQLNLAENLSDYFAVAVLIVLSGMLISELAPFGVATLAVAGFSVVLGQFASRSGTDGNAIIQTIIFGGMLHFILATMSYFNARTINQSLRQMRWQNQELLKVNHQFEQNMQADLTIATAVSDLSGDLSTISHDQSERAQSQAQSVAIVTSTLEELSATARQIAEVAESVFTATEQALRTAEAGGQSVGLSIDSIATLTGQVEAINDIANDLGGQSRRISEIVETITELAEETNLLALNATIEAAGAGEYGRRFAVVASEVQMLANRSRAASRDVQAILGQIRNLINNTLRATDEGLNEARRMSEIAGQAGEAIEQIIETVESTTFLARQINLTTQQQRSATDQAVDMIRQVASDAREAAARAQQLLQASDRLNDTAISLRRD